MCPCPICAAIAFILLPFWWCKWAQKLRKKHHCHCERCQEEYKEEHVQHKTVKKGKK